MRTMGFFPLLLTATFLCVPSSGDQFTSVSRADRFLSLFSVIRFKNSMCSGSSGLSGTCYTYKSCVNNGGTSSGSCADGFGTCCVTQLACGSRTANNCTYIESPNYPDFFNEARTCVQTISLNADACQVRLDVTEVNLVGPDSKGNCNNDVLKFSQDIKWTQVCGITQNTHFYLDVDPTVSGTLDFTFTTDGTSYNRRWRMKVSQICCDQLSMAPMGCGQYFTSTTGSITGWNSQGNPDFYLSGQNYAICLRQELNTCSTTYLETTPSGESFYPFCGDTLEWPGVHDPASTTNRDQTCLPVGLTGSPLIAPITIQQQGPHYFYFVTKDTANEHTLTDKLIGNINIAYTQNAC
ncbi:uncharacterized protein LOC135215741 [Macrobrachium nipponense]|uniref:uncharacterized protein LOC135215741 n=1 Tax=Macrobrachium nipponense TaxID=159736 RepID=UPI0030C8794A